MIRDAKHRAVEDFFVKETIGNCKTWLENVGRKFGSAPQHVALNGM